MPGYPSSIQRGFMNTTLITTPRMAHALCLSFACATTIPRPRGSTWILITAPCSSRNGSRWNRWLYKGFHDLDFPSSTQTALMGHRDHCLQHRRHRSQRNDTRSFMSAIDATLETIRKVHRTHVGAQASASRAGIG